MNSELALAILLVIAGGALEGLFSLGLTRTPEWKWENIWAMGSLAALVLLPWPVAYLTVPDLPAVYREAPPMALGIAFVCGLAWGFGGIFWGRAIGVVGIALGVSLMMGLVTVFGSAGPLAVKEAGKLAEPGGLALLGAMVVMALGIVFCALAGKLKDSELTARKQDAAKAAVQASLALGLTFCVASAVLSSMVNFGFVFGKPIGDQAKRHIEVQIEAAQSLQPATPEAAAERDRQIAWLQQSAELFPSNATWALIFTANFGLNFLYALYLMVKNKTLGRLVSHGRPAYWAWVLFMGVSWPLGLLLYGYGATKMGTYGPYVGFPMMLLSSILFGNLAGALTGEWRGTSARPRLTMVLGVLILFVAFGVFGWAQMLLD